MRIEIIHTWEHNEKQYLIHMTQGKAWARDELLPVICLYCQTPFGRNHTHNPDIIALAQALGRSPASVSWKMENIAALDESLDRKGAANFSKLDRQVWNEFFSNSEELVFKSQLILEKKSLNEEFFVDGKECVAEVKLRVNQSFFRKSVLAAYSSTCCVTGLNEPSLLVASHIIPWATDKALRLNIRNGLCLNALHDRAFDGGLMTLNEEYTVKYSRAVRDMKSEAVRDMLLEYEGRRIALPDRFRPNQDYLAWHREHIFLG